MRRTILISAYRSSYSFDVAWSNVLHALSAGACLAIPSDDERLNDIHNSMKRLKVNYAHFTPSAGRIVDPIPGLKTVQFSGEPLKRSDLAKWKVGAQILNTYGPCEGKCICPEYFK